MNYIKKYFIGILILIITVLTAIIIFLCKKKSNAVLQDTLKSLNENKKRIEKLIEVKNEEIQETKKNIVSLEDKLNNIKTRSEEDILKKLNDLNKKL